ncbi:MAG: hypothetical protein H0T89_23255 [Deltaproteobacteria bacterium]|nr:hypothetical protein [Deltaproteobacteria bacterium]
MPGDPKRDRGDTELLAAYVDGVSELSLDERRRVDDLLARDPALRADEAATRALIHDLRELPPEGQAPDWAALERSIHEAVGDTVPRPWYRAWRWIVPGMALATAAAIIIVLGVANRAATPGPSTSGSAQLTEIAVTAEGDGDRADDTLALWLDGAIVEGELDDDALLDDGWLDDEVAPYDGEPAAISLLGGDALEWVETLDGEDLERAEQWLDSPRSRRGRS